MLIMQHENICDSSSYGTREGDSEDDGRGNGHGGDGGDAYREESLAWTWLWWQLQENLVFLLMDVNGSIGDVAVMGDARVTTEAKVKIKK